MTSPMSTDVYYDPYDVTIGADPHPVFRRLREEAPLYYNERYDFYALSRYGDVERGLTAPDTYISGRGVVLEQIKSGMPIPPGTVIFEDGAAHTIHRNLLSRLFTPKKIAALEPRIREFCVRCLDPLVDAGRFDFIADLGVQVPMRVISMLLGIPEQDQEMVRDFYGNNPEEGKPHDFEGADFLSGAHFAAYIDWRAKNPSDDLMTELMTAEFEDETGTRRRLSRNELLAYINIVAAAGNETTGRLIGWTGKTLADHPDQRRELVEDPSLIPNAIEELLRYEPPALQTCRYVARDVEHYGQKVPEGSVMALLLSSANRDDRRYPDPDRFDIHRKIGPHLTFIVGAHYCLGAALARLEGRVVLEEVLKRFPEWEVDTANAKFVSNSTFRGWEQLPVAVA